MNKKGMGLIGTLLLVVGIAALYFIFKTGLIGDFITFIKGIF